MAERAMTEAPRVLLVEDEYAQREVLAYNLAAEGFVKLRQGAAAIDQLVPPLDDDVRIGADHLQPAGRSALEPVLIVAGAFGLIIDRAGAGDEGGLIQALEGQAQTLIERGVPVGAEERRRREGGGESLAARGIDRTVGRFFACAIPKFRAGVGLEVAPGVRVRWASECPSPIGLSDISDTLPGVRNRPFGHFRTLRTGSHASTEGSSV